MNLKENLGKLATFAVAVLLVILGLTVKLDTIKGWVYGTRITVSSTARSGEAPYFAGEVLRFGLEGVQSPRVYWAFDEGSPVVGSIEAQFAFPFDEHSPAGLPSDHRVDAFFKRGDGYRTASALVRTVNFKYAARVSVGDADIRVATPTEFASEWFLTGASIARFSGGKFGDRHSLAGGTDTGWVATKGDALETWGFTETAALPTAVANNQQAWTWYDFKNKKTGASLSVAQPVSQK